jgi:exopolysaccharide biosynthesis polyprenyl glycosylphosphotransferase
MSQTRSTEAGAEPELIVVGSASPSVLDDEDRAATTRPDHRKHAIHRWSWAIVPLLDAAAVATVLAASNWVTALGVTHALLTWLAIGGLGRGREMLLPRVTEDAGGLSMRVALVAPVLAIPAAASGQTRELLMATTAIIPAVLLARVISFGVLRRLRRMRIAAKPAVIVGTGDVALDIAGALDQHAEYGLVAAGFVDDVVPASLPLPYLGSVSELPAVVTEYGIERIIVAYGHAGEMRLVDTLRRCEDLGADVLLVPRLFEIGRPVVPGVIDDLWGYPIVRLRLGRLRGWHARVKRAIDVFVAALLLVLGAPIMLGIALTVRMSSPGPILFRQLRVGRRGREFELLKFRTMKVNGDSDTTWSVGHDPRVTAVGRLLRRTSLDELPQLFNVLRGDMSLVGPRPERPYFARRFSNEIRGYADRHRAPPGMTGWAQVHGLRGNTSVSARARFDNGYLDSWSVTQDVAILGMTLAEVVRAATERNDSGSSDAGASGWAG